MSHAHSHSPYMHSLMFSMNSFSSSVSSRLSSLSLDERFTRIINLKIKIKRKDAILNNGDMKAKTRDINELITGDINR